MGGGASTAKAAPRRGPSASDSTEAAKPAPLGKPLSESTTTPSVALTEKSCPLSECTNTTPAALSDEERAEVAQVLARARVKRPVARQRQLASAIVQVEKHPPGAELDGAGAWAGERLVLSGAASVLVGNMLGEPLEVEVATLSSGDSFGWWPSAPQGDDLHLETWAESQPRILVTSDAPLRLCRLPEEEGSDGLMKREVSKRSAGALGRARTKPLGTHTAALYGRDPGQAAHQAVASEFLLAHNEMGQHHPLSDCLAGMWLSTSASSKGIAGLATGVPRAHFLAALWSPLLCQFEEHLDEIKRRKTRGYRIHDCFPIQGRQIAELASHVTQCSEVWYGKERGGNLSAMYRWFIDAMEVLGVTAYSYSSIPKVMTKDGWVTVVDGDARKEALKGKGANDSLYAKTGGVAQRQGRSAIDNTILRNVFKPREAAEMFIGRNVRKFCSKLIAVRQKLMCDKLSDYLQLDMVWMSQAAHHRGNRVVRAVLRTLEDHEVRAAGVDPASPCFRNLRDKGSVIAGFGQLEAERQQAVQEVAQTLVGEYCDRVEAAAKKRKGAATGSEAEGAEESIFDRLVAWFQQYPGEFFEHDKHLHVTVLIAGMFSRNIIVVKRSVMEKFTLARYIPLSWTRLQPLWGTSASGPFQVRQASVKEASCVRANECPYAALHGMSMSAGGYASDHRRDPDARLGVYSLMMEMQWVRDPSSNIENWYITDIEKIVQEAWQLNPRGPMSIRLPGECCVIVGQNPKVGSSIKQTQHTQLSQGSLSDYPVLQAPSRTGPRTFEQLGGASMEVVDVGPSDAEVEDCGVYVRLRTPEPTRPEVLKFLVDLRHRVMTSVEKASDVDFLMLALRDESGGFVLVIAPLAQLEKVTDDPADFAVWANPLTGESSETACLQESRVDFAKGVGHFLVARQDVKTQLLADGKGTLERIWAFNRVPGVRAILQSFLAERGLA